VNRRVLSGVAPVRCAAACLSRSPTLEPGTRATLFVREQQFLGGVLAPARGVIPSTEDRHLPAAPARPLFGPDDERRRFHAIRAGSHTFAGARDTLYEQARVALEWIVACGPRNASAVAARMA
jgi:hypothetical protein